MKTRQLLSLAILCMCFLVGCSLDEDSKVDPLLLATATETIPVQVEKDAWEDSDTSVDLDADRSAAKVKSQFIPATKDPTQIPPSPTTTPEFKICSPLAPYPMEELREIVSAPYKPPPPGKEERHHGVDFSHYRRGELLTIEGVQVQVVLPGFVAAALGDSFPYGNVVIIETPATIIPVSLKLYLGLSEQQSLYTLFAHMRDAPDLKIGDLVYACQSIGQVGKSGNTVEPHLHFETRTGPSGASFTAMRYYQPDATEEEKEAYLRWRISGEFNHFDPMSLLLFNRDEKP